MGPEGAVNIIYRKELKEAKDPTKLKEKLVREYRERFANPYYAAALGYIDEVIEPAQTRGKVVKALKMLANKRQKNPPKKHGSIPL